MNTYQKSDDSSSTRENILHNVINRPLDGSQQAVHIFLDKYKPLINKYLNIVSLGNKNHEDLQQNIFLRVFRGLVHFKRQGTGSFRAWLMTIVKSVHIDWQRKTKNTKRVRNLDPKSLAELAKINESHHSDARRKDLMAHVLRRVKLEFKPRIWEIFVAVKVQGKSADEAAQECSTTKYAVFAATRRVMHRVHEIIASGDYPREFAE